MFRYKKAISILIFLLVFIPAILEGTESQETERLYLKGRALAYDRKYAEALDTLKLAYSQEPANQRILLLLGDTYLKIGHLPGAEQAFKQLRELDTHRAFGYIKLAELYWHWEKYDLSLEYLKTAAQLSTPPDPMVFNWQGQVLRSQQKLHESDSILRAGLGFYPGNPYLLANYGTTRALLGDTVSARLYIDSAYQIDSSSVFTANTEASLRLMYQDLPAASRFLERAIFLDPDDLFTRSNQVAFSIAYKSQTIQNYFREGNANFQKSLYGKAKESYLKALLEDSLFFEALMNLGFTYIHLGDPEQAALQFERALRIKSDYIPAYVGWGDALVGQGEYDLALVKYQKALELSPNDSDLKAIYDNLKRIKATKENKGE